MEENTADGVSHPTVVADKEEPPHQEGSDAESEASSVDNGADEEVSMYTNMHYQIHS